METEQGIAVISPYYENYRFSLLRLFLLCSVGAHVLPRKRMPPGPIAAECPCCQKMFYCYSLDINTRGVYMSLMIPNYPRVLGTIASYGGGQNIRLVPMADNWERGMNIPNNFA